MSSPGIRIFVPDVPEFEPLVTAAERDSRCRVGLPLPEYRVIEADAPLEFRRRDLGLKPAVWYGLFTGGLKGRIEIFDREKVRIVPSE